MKKRLALLLLLLGPVAGAAGSRAVTSAAMGDGLTRYTIIWTSDGSGAVDGDLGGLIRAGYVFQAFIVPGAGGSAPTDQYDVELRDGNGVNVLSYGSTDAGANLSATTPLAVQFLPPYFHDGTPGFELVVANAGDTKGGTVVLFVRATP